MHTAGVSSQMTNSIYMAVRMAITEKPNGDTYQPFIMYI